MREAHVFSATENDGVIDGAVSLAGGAAVETQRVVQQRAVAFLNRVELLNEVRVHLIEERNVLGHVAVVFLFVRQFVEEFPRPSADGNRSSIRLPRRLSGTKPRAWYPSGTPTP